MPLAPLLRQPLCAPAAFIVADHVRGPSWSRGLPEFQTRTGTRSRVTTPGQMTWNPEAAGRYELCVRATDAAGNVQPAERP